MNKFLISFLCLTSPLVLAQDIKVQRQDHAGPNLNLRLNSISPFKLKTPNKVMPMPELYTSKYLLIGGDNLDSEDFMAFYKTLAENLPNHMLLVVVVNEENVVLAQSTFSQWISPERLVIVKSNSYSLSTWARDAFPTAVQNTEGPDFALIFTHYPRAQFNAHDEISKAVLNENILREDFSMVGGNFMSDSFGNCFSVQGPRLFDLNEYIMKNSFGCKSVTLLPHINGIGDIDEVIKLLPNKIVLSNVPQYEEMFRKLGYKTISLPDAGGFRTYVNSLILDKKVFMPVYNQEEDLLAAKIYEKLGYEVYSINSVYFSDSLHGSIHCMTMTYPFMQQQDLLRILP